MHAHHPFISVSIAMGQRAPLAVLGCRDTSSDVAPARQRVEKQTSVTTKSSRAGGIRVPGEGIPVFTDCGRLQTGRISL